MCARGCMRARSRAPVGYNRSLTFVAVDVCARACVRACAVVSIPVVLCRPLTLVAVDALPAALALTRAVRRARVVSELVVAWAAQLRTAAAVVVVLAHDAVAVVESRARRHVHVVLPPVADVHRPLRRQPADQLARAACDVTTTHARRHNNGQPVTSQQALVIIIYTRYTGDTRERRCRLQK